MVHMPAVPGVGGSGGVPPLRPPAPASGAASAGKTRFTDTLKQLVEDVDALQQQADHSVRELLSGKSDNVHAVVMSVVKADLSFKLLVELRNKLVDAYKQTMNLRV